MSKIISCSSKDSIIFRSSCQGTQELVQDTFLHIKNKKKYTKDFISKKDLIEEEIQTHFLSRNNFSSINFDKNPVCYLRSNTCKNELKKLKNGKYYPDIFMDLHGLNKNQAIKALGKLIFKCIKEKLFCASIIHGHGKNILKNQVPIWLSQHPDIIAFHQSPQFYGDYVSILVLIEVNIK
ncbi:endonuclease SmrB [Buchnera aphidicola (Kurisakia onigurumii)]|uniref:endonuclease SmrB n=1 Tax=Buchnera aphidicola TaxID=9 RepID=UPI0031B67EA3